MPLVFKERNGRKYVYRSVTKRVSGKKNPVSKKEYLGTMDPATEMINLKPMSLDEVRSMIQDGEFKTLDRGNVLIALQAARSMGISDALNKTFGDYGNFILALAVCYAVDPTSSADIMVKLRKLDLYDVLGNNNITKKDLNKAERLIDYEAMIKYVKALNAEEPILMFGINEIVGTMKQTSAYRVGNSFPSPNASMIFLTGRDGRLLYAMVTMGAGMNIKAWRWMVDSNPVKMKKIRVFDEWTDEPETVARLVLLGDDFVARCVPCSDELREMLRTVQGQSEMKVYRGTVYSMIECTIGLHQGENGWSYVSPELSELKNCQFKVKLFACRPESFNRKHMSELGYSKDTLARNCAYCSKSVTPEDIERIIADMNRQYGAFVIMTTMGSWDEMMFALHIRTVTMKQSYALYHSVFSKSEGRTHRGWERFVMMISIAIRSRIEMILDENNSNMTVDDVLSLGSNYRVVINNGRRINSRRDCDLGRVLCMFGIDTE